MSTEAKNLPVVNNPGDPERLLARYDEAKRAITECRTLAACKNWSDKAAAMRAYAALAKDDSLRLAALKFQAYADRRAGEILKEIEPARGANQNIREGDHPKVTRESAASDAGMSEHQRKTALRLANIPEEDFEAAVESDEPPTITELAMRGTVARPPEPKPAVTPATPQQVESLIGALRGSVRFYENSDPAAYALGCDNPAELRRYAETIAGWFTRLVSDLPADV